MKTYPQQLGTLFCILGLALFALAVTGPDWRADMSEIAQAGEQP